MSYMEDFINVVTVNFWIKTHGSELQGQEAACLRVFKIM